MENNDVFCQAIVQLGLYLEKGVNSLYRGLLHLELGYMYSSEVLRYDMEQLEEPGSKA